MSVQSFACPACGSRKALADAHPGEKIHCTCGMSFPASPVFAVADDSQKATGPGWAVFVGVALVVGVGGVTIWHVTRPPIENYPIGPVAFTPIPVEPADHQATHATEPSPAESQSPTTASTEKPPVETVPPPPPPPPPPPTPPPVPVASVTAVKLWDAFDLDPAAAVSTYSGKYIEVTAHGRVARDSFDRPYLGAEVVNPRGRLTPRMTAEERQWEKNGYPPSVRCYLSPEAVAALANVPPDQEVVLRGVCAGRKNVESVYRGYIVELSDCTVVAPK